MRVRARTAFALSLVPVLAVSVSASAERTRWERVAIPNTPAEAAVKWSLDGAADWLANPECRTVFSDFVDEEGTPLTRRLEKLGIDEVSYLDWVVFRDGSGTPQCDVKTRIMFTAPGHRVVFVCQRRTEELWVSDRNRLKAIVIHEALHTLGLGENPPSSSQITAHVLKRCDRPASAKAVSSGDSRASRPLLQAKPRP